MVCCWYGCGYCMSGGSSLPIPPGDAYPIDGLEKASPANRSVVEVIGDGTEANMDDGGSSTATADTADEAEEEAAAAAVVHEPLEVGRALAGCGTE